MLHLVFIIINLTAAYTIKLLFRENLKNFNPN